MFGNNHEDGKTDTGIFTVDGKEYYVLFSEAVDHKKKGEIIHRIKQNVKNHNQTYIRDLDTCYVMVTSNKEVFYKRQRIKRNFESTKVSPKYEEKVAGEDWLFYIRSNVPIEQRPFTIATEVERVLYETRNNKRSAEYNVKRITGADFVRIVRKGGHFIVYTIFDKEESEDNK